MTVHGGRVEWGRPASSAERWTVGVRRGRESEVRDERVSAQSGVSESGRCCAWGEKEGGDVTEQSARVWREWGKWARGSECVCSGPELAGGESAERRRERGGSEWSEVREKRGC